MNLERELNQEMLRTEREAKRIKLITGSLEYDPNTGLIKWKKRRGRACKGKEAGSFDREGYRRIVVDRSEYRAHRIAWLLHYGEWPPIDCDIDHVNGERDDNRIANLRVVTRRENLSNLGSHRAGKLIGATFVKRVGRWQSQIWIDGRCMYLGLFACEMAAHQAYIKALEALQ